MYYLQNFVYTFLGILWGILMISDFPILDLNTKFNSNFLANLTLSPIPEQWIMHIVYCVYTTSEPSISIKLIILEMDTFQTRL